MIHAVTVVFSAFYASWKKKKNLELLLTFFHILFSHTSLLLFFLDPHPSPSLSSPCWDLAWPLKSHTSVISTSSGHEREEKSCIRAFVFSENSVFLRWQQVFTSQSCSNSTVRLTTTSEIQDCDDDGSITVWVRSMTCKTVSKSADSVVSVKGNETSWSRPGVCNVQMLCVTLFPLLSSSHYCAWDLCQHCQRFSDLSA